LIKGLKKRRSMFGTFFVLALFASVAFATATPAQPASASRSCVRAPRPQVRRSTLYAKVKHSCSGSQKMYAFIQARVGRGSHVYTLASGMTTGKYLKIGAPRCIYSGRWHVWTVGTRGLVNATSRVVNYSCSSKQRPR
jgi:hypothetical protein